MDPDTDEEVEQEWLKVAEVMSACETSALIEGLETNSPSAAKVSTVIPPVRVHPRKLKRGALHLRRRGLQRFSTGTNPASEHVAKTPCAPLTCCDLITHLESVFNCRVRFCITRVRSFRGDTLCGRRPPAPMEMESVC